jgi:hypothetical protein
MKSLVWTIGGLLAAVWTGTFALAALLVEGVATALQQAGPAAATAASGPPALPSWLAGWVEPASWAAVAQGAQQALAAVQSVLPAVGTATGWLEPLIWVLWGFGLLALLAAAAGSHWLLARRPALPGAVG